jgi:hypothetical protein
MVAEQDRAVGTDKTSRMIPCHALRSVSNHLHCVQQPFAARRQTFALGFLRQRLPAQVRGRGLLLFLDFTQFVLQLLDLFHQFGFAVLPFGHLGGSGFGM